MEKINKYNDYCSLLSQLNSKSKELLNSQAAISKLKYEIGTVQRKIRQYKELVSMSPSYEAALKNARMRNCLQVVEFSRGGELSDSPLSEFKESAEYKSFSDKEKKLFARIEPSISASQYSIQNAIIIGQDDDEEFDPRGSAVIEDYINETLEAMPDYDTIHIQDLRKTKEIIYKFVEQVSKL